MQNMSTQQYQATPSYLTQGLGAVGTLAGAYKAFGQKEGGVVNMKEGGAVPSYAGPEGSVVDSVRAKLEEMASQPGGVERVKQIAQTSPSDEVRKLAAVVVAEHTMQAQAEQQVTPAPRQDNMGIAALPAPSMDNMAGGGIIAFAAGDEVEDPDLEYLNLAEKQRNMALQRAGIMNPANSKMKEFLAKQVGALPGVKESEKGLMMMDYFSNLGSQTGPLPYAALKAAKETTPTFRKGLESIKKAEADVIKSQNDLENADRLDALGLNKEASELRKNAEANKKALEIARMQTEATLKAAGMNATRQTDADKRIETIRQAIIAKLPENQRAAAQKDPAIAEQAQSQYFRDVNLAGPKLDVQEETAADKAVKEATKDLKRKQAQYDPTDPEHGKLQEQINRVTADTRARYNKNNAPGTPTPVPNPNPAAVQALPMPPAQSDLVKGKVYNTARGPAEWNGSAFVAVR
jgi:hypothetical protein